MAIIQQDTFMDDDGTVVRDHHPPVGRWYWSSSPGNMYPEINGNRLTGSTDYRDAGQSSFDRSAHFTVGGDIPTEVDVHATFTVASLDGEIGFTYWDNEPYGFYRAVYKVASAAWHLDKGQGGPDAYDGDNQPVTVTLDSWAQTLTVGQSVAVLIQVRGAGATVLIGGTQRLASTDVTQAPGAVYTPPGTVGTATGRADCGVWMFSGTATTGLQLTSYELDSLPLPGIPQGSTRTIPVDGGDCPGVTDRLYWAVRNPSGTVIATSDAPAGWSVTAPDTAHLTVTAPALAPVDEGYQARLNPNATDPCVSAGFDVTPAGGGGGGGGGGTPPARRRRVCGC